VLSKFEIGDLDVSVIPSALSQNKLKPENQIKFEKAYRELRAKILAQGLFNASIPYYVYKVLSNLILLTIGVYCAISSKYLAINMIGSFFVALFWQQCGWLAHDFLHHQVFRNRKYGDMMGLIVGDLFQGFSVQWWKGKHNSHHAVPNLHSSHPEACDGDPDIDTMPLLAWTIKMAESVRDDKTGRFFIKWQSVLYFPILLFARIAWAHQSWVFVWGGFGQHSTKGAALDRKRMAYPVTEKIFLVLHYAFSFWVLSHMSILNAVLFYLGAQMMCGLMLALVFGLGHNGMSVYPADQRPDFWKLQVTTTRNVTSTLFVDWFCGGLQYQVDHHLFPMIPRHNLKKVHAMVEKFCIEENVAYHEADMFKGTVEVLSHLNKVSFEFLKEFPAM
jgi:fatty acid desaturase